MSITSKRAAEVLEMAVTFNGCGRTTSDELRDAVCAAQYALRKRTPTMVTHEASIYACHTCPSCKNVVDETTEFVPGQKIRVQAQWCKFCGQALKWEE